MSTQEHRNGEFSVTTHGFGHSQTQAGKLRRQSRAATQKRRGLSQCKWMHEKIKLRVYISTRFKVNILKNLDRIVSGNLMVGVGR